jgi:hypothetical protein
MATAAAKSPTPAWDARAARRLLSRAAFAGTPDEVARLAAMPLEKAVDALLDAAAAAPGPARPAWVRDPWTNDMRSRSGSWAR